MRSARTPKISIVTPSFNQAYFLEATIQSILSQKYPNLEYIIIDGGSTDGSIEIIKKYEQYLHFWCSEPDGGHYNGVNKGFAQSTGEIMAWLNSDDMYYPWTLRTVASIFSQFSQIQWLTTLNHGHWDREGFCLGFKPKPGYSREAFLEGNYLRSPDNPKSWGFIQQESSFWSRRLWEKTGSQIRERFKLAGDFDLWMRFYLQADLFATVSPLGGFRVHQSQRSADISHYIQEAKESLAEMRETLDWSPSQCQNSSLKAQLSKISFLKQLFPESHSFHGKRIRRTSLKSIPPEWTIEEYEFP